MSDSTRVYTDGACKGNPGPGGWAWIVTGGRWASGFDRETTNQRMELAAALDATRNIGGPLTIVSDSTYVVNCFTKQWWKGWLARDWKNSQRKPVANRDLWEPLLELYLDRGDVAFEWVKGHSGDEWNDYADRLAVRAAEQQHGDSGDAPPSLDDLEPDTSPTGAADPVVSTGRDERLPAGRLIAVLGHRPPELGGYDDTQTHDAVGRKLDEIIEAKRTIDDDLVVVSGLRQGAETLGAEAARRLGVPYVAVMPYPDADAKWPSSVRRRFAELIADAEAVVTLESKPPSSATEASRALSRRDGWLRQNVDEAIIVWDGTSGWVERTWRSFEDSLDAEVWVLDPGQARRTSPQRG